MPNSHDKNWVRVCSAIDGFRSNFGRWPKRIRVMPVAYENLVTEVLTPIGFALVSSFVELVPEKGAEMIADDETGAEFCYGTGNVITSPSEQLSEPSAITSDDSAVRFFGSAVIREDPYDWTQSIALWDAEGNPVNPLAQTMGKRNVVPIHVQESAIAQDDSQTGTKSEQYTRLVDQRKRCRRCNGLRNPAESELAQYDSDEIGPWTRLHGDLNAKLMIIGQDWGDVRYYSANQGLDDLNNPTMRTLEHLLNSIGVMVSLSKYGSERAGVFLTNAILCLKDGGLQGPVQPEWFTNCGAHFLRRQIQIVAPTVVVTLGQKANDATAHAFGIKAVPLRQAVESKSGTVLPNGSRLLAVYHCGQRTLNTHRPLPQQEQDWMRVERAMSEGLAGES